jgi:hypothetical protein
MADATGEAREPPLRVAFDRRLELEFQGARITSDGGLLAYRELDDALGLTATAASALAEGRRGTNIRHRLASCGKRSMDASPATKTSMTPNGSLVTPRCGRSSAGKGSTGRLPRPARWAGSRPSEANLAALTDLSGAWGRIDRLRGPPVTAA